MSGRVLVTGGLGFIGSAFVRPGRRRRARVLNVDADTYAGDERRLAEVAPGLVETVRIDVASAGAASSSRPSGRPGSCTSPPRPT